MHGESRQFHSGLKSNDLQTSPTGSTLAQKQYDAFGNTLATTGTPTSPFHHAGPYGYQSHPDHNLQLLGYRSYDPSTGRFLTRDSAKDGRNWYTYCENSLVSHIDSTGLIRITVHWYGVSGIVVHYYIVIEDNVKGRPSYGQKWYVSGYPVDADGNLKHNGFNAYLAQR